MESLSPITIYVACVVFIYLIVAVFIIYSHKSTSRIRSVRNAVIGGTFIGILIGIAFGWVLGIVISEMVDPLLFGMSIGAAIGCNFGFLADHHKSQVIR